MKDSNFPLYFKIADDYIASGYSLSEYYDKGIEPFYKKYNLDCYTIVSKEYLRIPNLIQLFSIKTAYSLS